MFQKIFHPTTNQVTIVTDVGSECVSLRQYYARHFVIEHLHWNGRYESLLSRTETNTAWLMCDGFGPDTPAEYKLTDWSHVRDSSWEAFEKIAEQIAVLKWNRPFDDQLADMIANAEALKEFYPDPVAYLDA